MTIKILISPLNLIHRAHMSEGMFSAVATNNLSFFRRHRNSLFRIRIDSEYFTPTHVPSFSVSPDTTHLVIPSTASESPSHQRNHSNSCASRSHLSQRSFTPENNLLSQSTPTTDICENSEICVQNNVIVDSAQLNTCAQISTDSPNGQEMVSSFSHNNRRLSISISTSDQLPVINNTHHENSEIQRNQSTSDTVASGTINRQSLPNEIAGSRATLTNGVVISPPRYNDVIKTATRLPSVIVSRPSRSAPRHILFSL